MSKQHGIQAAVPRVGFARLPSIIGDPKAEPPILPIIPVSKSSWWAGVKKGIYPTPIKLSERVTAWKWEDIHNLVSKMGGEA